jgi:SPP1 gp7 family putative phage head morphogenesis protein
MATEIPFTGKTLDPATAGAIADDVLIQGARPVTWWRRQGTDLHNKFMDTVRQSMEAGEGIDKMRKRIGGGVIDGVQVPGIMASSKANAETLARTAVNKVTNEARLRTFEENPDIIKGLKQVSTLDNRTSVICVAYDGQTWQIPGYEPIPPSTLPFNGGPPRHFNCRSTTVPILKSWEELGLPYKDLSPSTRASMDGQVPADQTFDKFLKKKGKTFQDKLLGPVRARLWRSGKITLQQMLDFRGQPLTPDELAALAKKKRVARRAAAAAVPVAPTPSKPTEPAAVVPEFKNSAEAETWYSQNMLRKDNTGLGWIKSYDRQGLRIVAEVTYEMKQRFNMQLPSYFGDPAKHPKFRFRNSRGALASVHMPSDSLLTKTTGLNKAPNTKLFERYTSERYKNYRLKKTVRPTYTPGQVYKRQDPIPVVDWMKAEAEAIGDARLLKAVEQSIAAGNEFTAGDSILTGWQDLVRKSFIHETGHRVHAQNLQAIDAIFADTTMDARTRYLWKRQTSEYAATNAKEWFAESFVHYIEGRHDRVYPPLLKWLKAHDKGL